MATLTPGQVFSSRSPRVTVENPLRPGAWRFRLTVVDNDGNESAPAELVVTVTARATVPPITRIMEGAESVVRQIVKSFPIKPPTPRKPT